jgi:hypothetical protein
MRRNMRKLFAVVALGVVVVAVVASMALAGTNSKLPAAQPAAPIAASSSSAVQPDFLGGIVNDVKAALVGAAAVKVVSVAYEYTPAAQAALEASTYTTIALATPAGGASSSDVQFDNPNG